MPASRAGLIAIQKQVERAGGVHTQTYWVKPEDAPAARASARASALDSVTPALVGQIESLISSAEQKLQAKIAAKGSKATSAERHALRKAEEKLVKLAGVDNFSTKELMDTAAVLAANDEQFAKESADLAPEAAALAKKAASMQASVDAMEPGPARDKAEKALKVAKGKSEFAEHRVRVAIARRAVNAKLAKMGEAPPPKVAPPPATPPKAPAATPKPAPDVGGLASAFPAGSLAKGVAGLEGAHKVGEAPAATPDSFSVTEADFHHATLKAAGVHGKHIPVDASRVEGHDMRAVALTSGGKPIYEVNWKVTDHGEAETLKLLKAAGAVERPRLGYGKTGAGWPYYKRTSVGERKEVSGMTADCSSLVLKGNGWTLEYGTSGALRNSARLTVDGSDPKDAMRALAEVGKLMDSGDVHSKPSGADHREMARQRVLSKFFPEKAARSDEALKKADETWQSLKEADRALLQKFVDDAEMREVSPGHHAAYSKSLAGYFSNVKALVHDTSNDDDVIVSMMTRGLLCTSSRFERGIFSKGMSSPEDFPTGGADGFFTRVSGGPGSSSYDPGKWGSSKGARFEIDPAELGRLDWWARSSDSFGHAGPPYSSRWTAQQIKSAANHPPGGNEVMFQKGIRPEAVRHITVGTSWRRDELVAKFKAAGVHSVGGRKVEDIVRVSK